MVENETNQIIKCLRLGNGESLPQMSSMSFARHMELRDNFQLQKLLNKMGLLKGKTEQSKKMPELCSMKQNCQTHFGEKLYTQLSTYLTENNSE